jgi:phosphotriesterase-related protein
MELQTVTGLVSLGEVKLVDGHAHVWIDPPEGVLPKHQFLLNDPVRIDQELRDFRSAGGTTLIDCQPGGCGRDGRWLAKLSEGTEIQITATTGFHLESYYPPDYWLWSASELEASDYFIKELTVGLHEYGGALATTIKVGYPGKIEGQTRTLMEAAAEAARQIGAAVLFHTEAGLNVEALPLFFDDRGVLTSRLYLCHVDKRPDFGLHRELAQAGALLGYDTFIRSETKPGQNVWPLLLEMVRAGHEDKIAIGLDMARSSRWRHFGGQPGLVYLADQLLSELHREGLSEAVVSKLTGQNVAKFLVRQTF